MIVSCCSCWILVGSCWISLWCSSVCVGGVIVKVWCGLDDYCLNLNVFVLLRVLMILVLLVSVWVNGRFMVFVMLIWIRFFRIFVLNVFLVIWLWR